MQLLAKTLPFVVQNGRAKSTVNKYKAGWENWVAWCAQKKEIRPRPADPFFVALYLNYLLFIKQNKGAITTAFYGIRWGHHIVGLESPTDSPLAQLTYEGCLRLCEGSKVRKDALPVETLRQFFEAFATTNSNLMDLRFLVVCVIGFAGFLRIQELLSVQLKHLTFHESHKEIFLTHSKVDQHRDGEKVYIARTRSPYCPVTLVERFLGQSLLSVRDDEDAYLVPRLFKTKKGTYRVEETRDFIHTH